ncbi:MAG: response regulator [Pseudomonadota bacterium]
MAKILVIDDEEPVLEMLSLRLNMLGYQVVLSQDGVYGPTTAEREKPDLIILDFNMPAVDGAAVHQKLRSLAATAAVPIIFLTASVVAQVMLKVKADQKTRFLAKPIDFAALAKMIAEFLPPPK